MSEEGEGTEGARKVVVSEKEGNVPDLSGEGIMESVGSPEEEVKLITPVPAPHIIPSYFSSRPFFSQVSNPAVEKAKGNVSGTRGGNGGGEKIFRVVKGGKHPSFIWRGNYGVSWKS